MNGLASINIELTSRCNKSCWMCGRRRMEKHFPSLCDWGDMPRDMVEELAKQVPKGITVQCHNNGEPLLYDDIGWALAQFKGCFRCFDTNGKLLMDKARELIGNIESVTISVIPEDPDGWEQLEIAESWLLQNNRPLTVFRILGDIDKKRLKFITRAPKVHKNVVICHRVLHDPRGSFNYCKPPVIPEHGVCLEMLHKLSIDRYGNVYPCVRFDPHKLNLIANPRDYDSLYTIWNLRKRQEWVQHHIAGRRDLVPLCASCEFWGVPRG